MTSITFPRITQQSILDSRVYAKTSWTAEWELQEYVDVTKCQWSAAPSTGDATIQYRYGFGKPRKSTVFGKYNRFTLPTLAYLMIEFDVVSGTSTSTIRWYGVVGQLVTNPGGEDVLDGTTPVETGIQVLEAVGLSWLLVREYVDRTVFKTTNGIAEVLTETDFDKNRSGQKFANGLGDSSYVFSEYEEGQDDSGNTIQIYIPWTVRDIVEYLLSFHGSTRINNQQVIRDHRWQLSDPNGILEALEQNVQLTTIGTKVWTALNQLLAPQRGLGFFITAKNETPGAPFILEVFTFAAQSVHLIDGTILKANPNQASVNIAADASGSLVIVEDAFPRYHAVRARGDRALYTFTLSFDDGTLEKGWTDDDQTAYEAAASGEASYPTNIVDQQEANESVRSKLRNVFRQFQVPRDWNGKSGDGEGGTKAPAIPNLENPSSVATEWVDKIRILDEVYVPRYGFFFPHSIALFFERPFGQWFDVANDLTWVMSEGKIFDEHLQFKVQLVGNENMSFDLNVIGAPQYSIAFNNFNPLDEDPPSGSTFDYEKMIVTVTAVANHYCEVTEYSANTADPARIKTINVPGKRLIRIAENTVLGTADVDEGSVVVGDLERHSKDVEYEVDDRPELRKIAKMALAWYGANRNVVTIRTGLLTDAIGIGLLITSIEGVESTEVNTVVTDIVANFPVSQSKTPPTPKITYHTQFAEVSNLGG